MKYVKMPIAIKSCNILFLYFSFFYGITLMANDSFSEKDALCAVKERDNAINRLILELKTVQDKNVKASVMFALGEFRAIQAIPLLIKNIDMGLSDSIKRLPEYPTPVMKALIKIGLPAVPHIIDTLKTEDDDFRITLFCETLAGMAGKEFARFCLTQALQSKNDAAALNRLNKAILIVQ